MPASPAICVYMASSHGRTEEFTDAARATGRALAELGCRLVYGGGEVGLMGEVAAAAATAGVHVTGIITEHLLDREVANLNVDELIVVADMPSRKREMFERSDAFLTLPGGVGTMEEFFEILCWRYLGLHPKPVGLLNTAGFYDHLIAFLDHATDEGFVRDDSLVIDDHPERLLSRLTGPLLTGPLLADIEPGSTS